MVALNISSNASGFKTWRGNWEWDKVSWKQGKDGIYRSNRCIPDAWWKEFKGGWITVKPERTNPYQKELQGFCDNISSNKNVFVNGKDGLKALEVVFASYISKNERRWVDFPIPKNTLLNIPKYS